MKLLIVGSENIKEYDLSGVITDNVDLIISDGKEGVGKLAEHFAERLHISNYIVRPRYDLYGEEVHLKQKEEMIKMCEQVLVVWDGKSTETRDFVDFVRKKKKPMIVITLV